MKNKECPFCEKETINKQVVYIGNSILVILPRSPASDMHLMILTKRHTENFTGLQSEELIEIHELIKKITDPSCVPQEYTQHNIIMNSGESAGQHINHFHLHLFFRYAKEGYSALDVLSKKIKKKDYSKEEWQSLLTKQKNLFTKILS